MTEAEKNLGREAVELSESSESARTRVFAQAVLDYLPWNTRCGVCGWLDGEHHPGCEIGQAWITPRDSIEKRENAAVSRHINKTIVTPEEPGD